MQVFLINAFFYLILFFMGASLGSFSLVVVSRRIKNENWIKGKSKCDNCGHELSWKDLIPLLSFIFLSRKCRYCKSRIGWENFIIEIIFGSFAIIFWKLYSTNIIQYLLMLIFFMFSLMATLEDIKTQDIDDAYVIPGFIIGFLATFIQAKNGGYLGDFFKQVIFNILAWPGSITVIILLSKLIIHKEGMGWGDVTMALMFTGVIPFKNLIFAIFLSFMIGAAFAIFLQVKMKKGKDYAFSFGPFIAIGSYISLIWGSPIINWWLKIAHLS